MAHYKILAMDGGLGRTLASILHSLHDLLDGDARLYMNEADLLAGTSVGAMTCLFFANHVDPAEALQDWDNFNRVAFRDMIKGESLPNFVGGLLGFNSMMRFDNLRDCLLEYFGSSLTLGDLKKKVLVTAFELDNGETGSARQWRPRVFTNLTDGPDNYELVVDVALRSSSLPCVFPIYQSVKGTGPAYVDGFVVANNPSMIAMLQVMDDHPLHEQLVFSLGTGANIIGKTMYLEPGLTNGMASWGYRQWLLDPRRPLLLLDLMSQANLEAIDMQCQKLLKDRYFRVEPVLVNEAVEANAETQDLLKRASQWLKASGWLDVDSPPALPVAAAPAAVAPAGLAPATAPLPPLSAATGGEAPTQGPSAAQS